MYIGSLLIAIVLNLVLFLIAFTRKSDKLTDFTYGATFVVIAAVASIDRQISPEKSIVTGMVALWAIRLASYLVIRIRKINRDKRFDGVRENFVKFGSFWLFQAISAWIIMIPTIALLNHQQTPDWLPGLLWIGVAIWLVGFICETVADTQKYRFINNPANKGQWIDSGLWHYSRHPNYFGEITMWLGIYVAVWSYLSPALRLVGLVSPLWITTLLLFISGIPKLEKQADERWGKQPGYQAYKRSTSILIPFFKRSKV